MAVLNQMGISSTYSAMRNVLVIRLIGVHGLTNVYRTNLHASSR